MKRAELEAYLHRHIPMSAAMRVRVIENGPQRVVLEAPLEPNLHHRATAFGGSVVTLAILAAWVQVHFRLQVEGRTVHTVIQKSTMDYDLPVRASFRATCARIDDPIWERFCRTLDRRGKGRVSVEALVEGDAGRVGHFRGQYVALTVDV